ncbi:MAG TPA: type II toxin-antitoxin system PemK/MazF family toxin [Thermoanaerobaculia bacterium]
MVIERGEVWWADLPDPAGSEPGYRRPVLIVQSDFFNQSRIRTVIVVGLTSNARLAGSPGNVPLARGQGGLARASVVNVSQLLTIERNALSEKIGTLSRRTMDQVDAGLKLVLEL